MPVGPWELAIILVIVVIIFGVGKLPEIGGALGKGIREFRESTKDPEDGQEATTDPAPRVEERRAEPIRTEAAREEL
jgi:sec-independent protein translocase protein TatA